MLTAGKGAAAYSLARGVAAAVTGESGGGRVLSGMRGKATAVSRAALGEKTPKPLLSAKHSMRAVRPQMIT